MQDNQYKKNVWGKWEDIAKELYESHWYICKYKNFTIRGGEIDLVMQNSVNMIFVEVKVVNFMDNLHDYITSKKLQTLKRAIDTYLWKCPTTKIVRMDVVFVKDDKIIEVYKNIDM